VEERTSNFGTKYLAPNVDYRADPNSDFWLHSSLRHTPPYDMYHSPSSHSVYSCSGSRPASLRSEHLYGVPTAHVSKSSVSPTYNLLQSSCYNTFGCSAGASKTSGETAATEGRLLQVCAVLADWHPAKLLLHVLS
jgi:hypothetical protein